MSRYLELSVEGTTEHVAERALRAMKRIGKVTEQDLSTAQITGIIKVDGEPAMMRVSWKSAREGRVRIEIAATSDDTLYQAADSALYSYASSYKAVGWPDPERDRLVAKQRLRQQISRGVVAVFLLTLVVLLIRATGYLRVR